MGDCDSGEDSDIIFLRTRYRSMFVLFTCREEPIVLSFILFLYMLLIDGRPESGCSTSDLFIFLFSVTT